MSRTHSKILEDAGGVPKVRAGLAEEGLELSDPTVRSWTKRPDSDGNIPSEYWPSFVRRGWASLEELAGAAERRKFPGKPPLSPQANAA